MDNIPINDNVLRRKKATERRQAIKHFLPTLLGIVVFLIVLIVLGFVLKLL